MALGLREHNLEPVVVEQTGGDDEPVRVEALPGTAVSCDASLASGWFSLPSSGFSQGWIAKSLERLRPESDWP